MGVEKKIILAGVAFVALQIALGLAVISAIVWVVASVLQGMGVL